MPTPDAAPDGWHAWIIWGGGTGWTGRGTTSATPLPRRSLARPGFNAGRDCAAYTPPARELGTHVAALGMRFHTGDQFPPEYRQAIFIAEHGSWNRSRKTG